MRKLLYASCAEGKFMSAPVASAIIKNTIRDGQIFDWHFYLVFREFLVCRLSLSLPQLLVEVSYLAVGDEILVLLEFRNWDTFFSDL